MLQGEVFRFGSLADIQYGDFDNKNGEGRCQRFREAPEKLGQALQAMQNAGVSFILTIGDIIEGHKPPERIPGGCPEDHADLQVILSIFSTVECPVVHTLGNHCVCLEREFMTKRLGMPACYYTRALSPGWKLIVLDTTDLSTGTEHKPCWPAGSPQLEAAQAYLNAHPQDDGPNQHMVGWNGGVGVEQMRWLQGELQVSEQAGERVIISAHHPIGLGCARRTHMAWNYEEVQAAICASKAVALVLAGHDHVGGYALLAHVHFVTQPALVEAPCGSNAFGIIKVFDDRIEIDGHGLQVPDRILAI